MIYMADFDNGDGEQCDVACQMQSYIYFFVELFSFQYYSELVVMVFYQIYTPIHLAWRGVFLIFRILIYFAPMIYMADFDNDAADNSDGTTSFRFYLYFFCGII